MVISSCNWKALLKSFHLQEYGINRHCHNIHPCSAVENGGFESPNTEYSYFSPEKAKSGATIK